MIHNTNGNRAQPTSIPLFPNDVKTVVWLVDGRTNWFIRGTAVDEVVIECKLTSQADSAYVNIETGELDLTPYNGTRQSFTFRFTTGAIAADDSRLYTITVGP